jgi:hypothetical protein
MFQYCARHIHVTSEFKSIADKRYQAKEAWLLIAERAIFFILFDADADGACAVIDIVYAGKPLPVEFSAGLVFKFDAYVEAVGVGKLYAVDV